MMKKLAVAVFALSLTALGCGSDDGGKNDAAPKLDTQQPGAEVQVPDAPQGAEAGPEVQRDTLPPIDQTVDKGGADQAVDQNQTDVPTPLDVPGIDGGLDTNTVDTQPGETAKPVIDGGVDTGSVG